MKFQCLEANCSARADIYFQGLQEAAENQIEPVGCLGGAVWIDFRKK